MRHTRRFAVLQRKGMALLLVMFIAFASLVLLTTLLSSVAPRRASVSGEVQADRALAVADGKIDLIMTTINTLPQVNVDGQADANAVQAAVIAGYEGALNGYDSDPNSLANASSVSTYFYHTTTNTWYSVWNDTPDEVNPDGHLMSIPATTKLGHEVGLTESASGTVLALGVKDLSDGTLKTGGIIGFDSKCRTNNEWFEADSNASYDPPTKTWTIKTSAYLLSVTGIVRTLEAKAQKQVSNSAIEDPSRTVTYNWYTSVNRHWTFSDYVFLYNFSADLGQNAEIHGRVHVNGTVDMGGWAFDPVSATVQVTDIATDDSNNHDGRFRADKKSVTWAHQNGYAVYPAAKIDWLAVDNALVGSNPARAFGADTGMQDKAMVPYYVDMNGTGTATITFSIESGAGKVTINNTKYDMPTNGIIYVRGNATVKGGNSGATPPVPGVLGSCMVGTSGNINLGGDILYNTPPRTGEDDPLTASQDFLGLVANGNIVIPYSTFQADKNLVLDASMVSDGWMGVNATDWQWHDLNTNQDTAPTLVVRGSMSKGDGANAFTSSQTITRRVNGYNVNVQQIKGYDLRQYNFDWNLKQVQDLVPAGFPTTGSGTVSTETAVLPGDSVLAQLTNPSAHPKGNPLVINGKAYYARATTVEGPSTWYGTGFVATGMFRIGWKEQVGEPVGGN